MVVRRISGFPLPKPGYEGFPNVLPDFSRAGNNKMHRALKLKGIVPLSLQQKAHLNKNYSLLSSSFPITRFSRANDTVIPSSCVFTTTFQVQHAQQCCRSVHSKHDPDGRGKRLRKQEQKEARRKEMVERQRRNEKSQVCIRRAIPGMPASKLCVLERLVCRSKVCISFFIGGLPMCVLS